MRDLPSPRRASWLPVAGLLVAVALALGWLLLVFAGDRTGMAPLPDAAGSTVEFLTDRTGRLTRADAERLPAEAWRRWTGSGDILADGHGALWARVTLRNAGERPVQGVLASAYFFSDRVEAWVADDGRWEQFRSGEAVAAPDKAVRGRDSAFAVAVPAHGERVVWLRAEDFFRPALRPEWWPRRDDFHAARTRGLLAEGIYLGGLFALLGYNMLLWLRLRLADIGWYVLYLGAVASFIVLARAHLPAMGWMQSSPALEVALTAVLAGSGFFLTQFARAFLETQVRSPRADRIARGLAVAMLGLAAGALTLPWQTRPYWMVAAVPALAATHVTWLVIGACMWRAGVWQARLFVLSFAGMAAGALAAALVWLGRAPEQSVAVQGLMIGSAVEMLLLALAVADRFARTQQRLVEETEQRRWIEETYADELEVEVRERTQELEAANEDKDRMLSIVGHDLRSPLTGLMRAADEAPGEFAKEAARTGRSLLLLIEDLVLWARLRAGTRALAVYPASAVVVPAVALHHALAERDGTELLLDVPEGLRVETDLVLVQTLVRNLLANGLKFARTRVVLRARADGDGGVRFTVGNDGPALSPEVAARIAADEDGPMTATGGLGLRLCREICRALELRLETAVGADGGTEFSFTLKAIPAPEVASA